MARFVFWAMLALVAMAVVGCADSTVVDGNVGGYSTTENPDLWEGVGSDLIGGQCASFETIKEARGSYPELEKSEFWYYKSCAIGGFSDPSFCMEDLDSLRVEYYDEMKNVIATSEGAVTSDEREVTVYGQFGRVFVKEYYHSGKLFERLTYEYDEKGREVEYLDDTTETDGIEYCWRFEYVSEDTLPAPSTIKDTECWVRRSYLRSDDQEVFWVSYIDGRVNEWRESLYDDQGHLTSVANYYGELDVGTFEDGRQYEYTSDGQVAKISHITKENEEPSFVISYEYLDLYDGRQVLTYYSWPKVSGPYLILARKYDQAGRLVWEDGFRDLKPNLSEGYEGELEYRSGGYMGDKPVWRFEQDFGPGDRLIGQRFYAGINSVQQKQATEELTFQYDTDGNVARKEYSFNPVWYDTDRYLGRKGEEGAEVSLYLKYKLIFTYHETPYGKITNPREYIHSCE